MRPSEKIPRQGALVLVDEYDSPINNAFGKDTFEDITEFMKLFYTSSLKRNGNMRFAVLTGVMRLAK
ncbi:MAG: AAA family ATPase, partial [Candidatus Methanomethylophilaceae archaeon]|nr:AAA family ATPase [Candidatus Methanomethylophilaceae archaeon]